MSSSLGVFVTFFDEGEPEERALPPIGPLEDVVLRHRSLIAERRSVQQVPDGARVERWIEAELEFQRATGIEPGGPRRALVRVTARGGVHLRFVNFAAANEGEPVPELGPFAVVLVGRRLLEADGVALATRPASSTLGTWELTAAAGVAHAGQLKEDVAFRAGGSAFHPRIRQGSSRADVQTAVAPRAAEEPPAVPERRSEHVERERAQSAILEQAHDERRQAQGERRRRADDSVGALAAGRSLRDRVGELAPPTPIREAPSRGRRDFRGALWNLRLPIVGLLVLVLALYGVTALREGVAGIGSVRTVAIGERVSVPGWEFNVAAATRVATAGAARPRGAFMVVRMGAINRGAAGAQLSPTDFELFDQTGARYGAESIAGPAYVSGGGPYSWPTTFPVGRSISVTLVFDIDPGAGGLQLGLRSEPNTRVRLG